MVSRTHSSIYADGARTNAPSEIEFFKHQFNKRLESFAPCYSQSLLLADFTENHTDLYTKNPRNKKTRVYSLFRSAQ